MAFFNETIKLPSKLQFGCVSVPSYAKQQREVTNLQVFSAKDVKVDGKNSKWTANGLSGKFYSFKEK